MKCKFLIALLLLIGMPFAATAAVSTDDGHAAGMHRYLVERTFPAGALDGLDAAAKSNIIANNQKARVHWLKSYVNADRNRTFCIYEGPDEAAIRKAAELNGLPVDSITEIPATLEP